MNQESPSFTSDCSSIALGPCLLTLAVALLVDFSSDTAQLGPFYGAGPALQTTSAACAAGFVVLGLLMLLPGAPRRRGPMLHLSLRLLPGAAALGSYFWTAPLISPRLGLYWDWFAGTSLAAFLLLALLSYRGVSALWLVGLAFVAGSVVRLAHFQSYPFYVGADMLPLVMSAVDALLHGRSPYGWYNLPAPLPLTYYPLTMLAYVPAGLLKTDPRYINLLAQLSIAGALWFLGYRKSATDERSRALSDTALVVWATVYLLPSSVYFDRITTAPIAWSALSWLLVLMAARSPRAWLALGLAAATTPLTAVCIPFFAIRAWQEGGLRKLALELTKAGALAFTLMLPWYLWAPQAYLDGTVLWFNDLRQFPGVTWERYRTWVRYVGFSGLFWQRGLEHWLKPIQASSLLLLSVMYFLRKELAERAPSYVAAAFAVFMAFNPIHWPYFYQPVIMAGLVAAAASTRRAQALPAQQAD
jgi:hypothetical protein